MVAREVFLWGQMSHQNILPFYGLYPYKGGLSMVLPWASNGTVADFVRQNSATNRPLLCSDIASGIEYLHSNGIVHGDLKSHNIFVDKSERAYIGDFGVTGLAESTRIAWQSHGGTVRWQSPELLEDFPMDPPNTKSTDIYAFSCVFVELFTGFVPFPSDTDAMLVYKVLKGERPALPSPSEGRQMGFTDEFRRLVQDCWRENPLNRPSIQEVKLRLAPHLPDDHRASLVAGGAAGTAVDLLFFPIDTVKTRLQSSHGFVRAGGFNGVYKGVGSVVVGSAPGAAFFFSTYETMKKYSPIPQQFAPLNHMISASVAEVAACLVRVPTEVIKTRTQTMTYGALGKSSFAAAKQVLLNDGWSGFYRGFKITIMREIPFTSLQFPMYELLKAKLALKLNRKPLYAHEAAVCGSIAGGTAAALTTPLDVLKTRVMLDLRDPSKEKLPSLSRRMKDIYVKEGARTLFSGVVPRTLWISAGGAVFLGVYDKMAQCTLPVEAVKGSCGETWSRTDFSNLHFDRISESEAVEEETMRDYVAEEYYPVRIGDLISSRYQVVGKLGYGVTSTVWLARDLTGCRYVALKIYICSSSLGTEIQHELSVYNRLDKGPLSHPGRLAIRTVLDSFTISGPHGKHQCIVHPPLWDSMHRFLKRNPIGRLPNISPSNIMIAVIDDAIFKKFEQAELDSPTPRKELDDGRIIYISRPLEIPDHVGFPVLCDFGSAVWGEEVQTDDVQPNIYRSPEVILGIPWSYEIDIWNVGCLVWDLFEGTNLFSGIDPELDVYRGRAHLAEMIKLMGPPPPEFVARGSTYRFRNMEHP
ncbi:hypothetical protein H0H93_000321 [Arthromyces matolae]|nr:hypothetical protein H0H93_000321 [Arthromyces matolae]